MIPLLAPALAGTLKTLAMTAISEKLIIETTFIILRSLVSSSKNELDDAVLKEFEKAYRGK